MYQQIDSDKLQGVIRKPFTFYFPIQRGFSRSIQTLPTRETLVVRVYRGCSVLRDPLHAPKPGAPYHVMSALNTLPIPHRGNDGTVCPVTPDAS